MARASRGQRILLIGLLTIALMAPTVLLMIGGQADLATLFVYGGAIAMGGIFYGLRLAIALSVLAGAAGIAAALLSPYTVPAAIFFGLLTGGCALAALRGLHSPVLMVPLFIGFVLVAPPQVAGASSLVNVLLTGAVIALGGLWMTGTARVLFGRPSGGPDRHPFGPRTTIAYAIVMAVVLGVAAWVVLTFAKYHQGAWLLLTLIIVMQPSPHDTMTKSLQRLAGTVAGGAVAMLLILAGLNPPYAVILGGVFFFIAFTARFALNRPYWEFVAALTPGIILLDAQGGDGMKVADDRVAFTVIGVVVVVAITVAIKAIVLRKAPDEVSA
jgi:hypothetical protein